MFLWRNKPTYLNPLDVKKVLLKMINRHELQFGKYNINNRDLIR